MGNIIKIIYVEINEIIEAVKNIWINSERFELISELENVPNGSATGTEGRGLVGLFLLNLRNNNVDAFTEVNDLIEMYVETCAKSGLILVEHLNKIPDKLK